MMAAMYAHIDSVTDLSIVLGSLAIVASGVAYIVGRITGRL